MERHKCRLCFKTFSNGRALGGHMRSHMMNLPVSEETPNRFEDQKLSEESEAAPLASSSSSSEEEGEEEEEEEDDDDDDDEVKDEGYGLRENPKKSIRLVDPEFSFAGSVVLQDRESETESSKNPTRRRSKRIRKSSYVGERLNFQQGGGEVKKKVKFSKVSESWAEPEPVSSSISDVTTEEDVAFCLMMMSRDKWKQRKTEEVKSLEEEDELENDDEEDEEEEDTDESEELEISKSNNKSKGKYRCETCKKTFRSYQALGGHRASHSKTQTILPEEIPAPPENNASAAARSDSKVHECPYCFRVFASGQALGGHKRSHAANYGSSSSSVAIAGKTSPAKLRNSFIDLNLPAPVDEDEFGQVEHS